MTTPRFLFIIVGSILLAEIIVVSYALKLRPLSTTEEVLLSTSLLTLFIAPILYYVLVRPARIYIAEQKRAEKHLQSMSLTDELTGLYSRRGFSTLADHQIRLARRQKIKTFLLYADLDNLKEINDICGQKEGDYALIQFGKILESTYRKSDIIAHLENDEFVVYPVGSEETEKTAQIVIDRFQQNLHMYNSKSKKDYELSASVGISSIKTESLFQ